MTKRREKIKELVSKLDIKGLEELWNRTIEEQGNGAIYTIRELTMNRMEEINPVAFERWLDADDETDFSFFYH